ncbi:hypothetical protein Tco_1413936 [Tanacetum coccineum]
MGVTQLDMTSQRWSVSTVTRWDTLQGNTKDLGTKIAGTRIKTALEGLYMTDDEVPINMAFMAFQTPSELEKLKQEKESNQLKIENFDNASKSLDKLIGSQISDKSRKGLGFPKFEGYGPKISKNFSEDIFNEVRETPDAPLVKELVLDDNLEKKIISPTVAKI